MKRRSSTFSLIKNYDLYFSCWNFLKILDIKNVISSTIMMYDDIILTSLNSKLCLVNNNQWILNIK